MSKDYNFEIGYETLQKEWEVYKKQTPRGVTLVKGGNNIYLQFKTPNTPRSKHKCNCTFSIDGMVDAVRKTHRVAERLKSFSSETEFWDWYKKEIEQEIQLADDRITFGEAITKVENDFWSRPSRTKRKRDKNNPSDQSSWYDTYGRFYKLLPQDKTVNLSDIEKTINNWNKGTKTYKGAIGAMKRLARASKSQAILKTLDELNVIQIEFKTLNNITLADFLGLRDETLGITTELHPNSHLDIRKAWLWTFSMQVIYGLRI
ncbi:MAG: hypothetical protein ACRDBG_16815, partial [Waterburya sp.]